MHGESRCVGTFAVDKFQAPRFPRIPDVMWFCKVRPREVSLGSGRLILQ